jgi:hypothetical protein
MAAVRPAKKNPKSRRSISGLTGSDLDYAVNLVTTICALAGSPSYLSDLRASARRHGLIRAVGDHDTPALFDWLVSAASFQGISDSVAAGYMERNGRIRWQELQDAVAQRPSCPKLRSYWHFHGCHYRKNSGTCSQPDHIKACPLPLAPLRNGNLNQLSFSLYLFIRDIAENDLVAWIDRQFTAAAEGQPNIAPDKLGMALIEPMRHIHGISDKILNLVLSTLLLGAGRERHFWVEAGAAMIAIDTLVHNFLARTGILNRANSDHPYGPQCYAAGGCADLIKLISANIDSRQFNSRFPSNFPRFVQKAIWNYCAMQGLNVCNGNKINDASRCANRKCRIFGSCDRISRY